MAYSEAMLTPGLGTGSDRPHNPRNPGYRKVQCRTEQSVVKLSTPRRKASSTGYTGCAMGGKPPFTSSCSLKLTAEYRFG